MYGLANIDCEAVTLRRVMEESGLEVYVWRTDVSKYKCILKINTIFVNERLNLVGLTKLIKSV